LLRLLQDGVGRPTRKAARGQAEGIAIGALAMNVEEAEWIHVSGVDTPSSMDVNWNMDYLAGLSRRSLGEGGRVFG
jgi:hypothetical protein